MRLFVSILLLALAVSCKENKETTANTSLDVGRNFIRASLDGNFTEAEKYLSADLKNAEYFNSFKTFYDKMPAEQKEGYRKSTYEINKIEDIVEDSVTIINYSTSYMHKPTEIKLIRENNKWAVDFQYTHSNNQQKP